MTVRRSKEHQLTPPGDNDDRKLADTSTGAKDLEHAIRILAQLTGKTDHMVLRCPGLYDGIDPLTYTV